MAAERELHDGRQDGLQPLESFDLNQIHGFSDLLRAMSKTAFGGRQVGEAFDILLEMCSHQPCKVVLTLSGAMTVAKQGRLICELIDREIVDAIVATGALIAHGLTESIGLTHYRHDGGKSDETLFEQGYNRIYDTLEMESNLNDVEVLIREVMSTQKPLDGVWSSARICEAVGQRLIELDEGPGILRSAAEKKVPVFIPAFTDSEIGLDVATWAMSVDLKGETPTSPNDVFMAVPSFNPFLDLQQYARFVGNSDELGILTIGGGVPRNWAQQVSPYFDITNSRLNTSLEAKRFRYGVRICPEPVHWGGLSGCTYSEGISWGKFLSPDEGGRYAEIYADATVVWPLLMKAVFEELDRPGSSS